MDTLPPQLVEWRCWLCQRALPSQSRRCAQEESIRAHFAVEHPGISPTDAYRLKQRHDPVLRARMGANT